MEGDEEEEEEEGEIVGASIRRRPIAGRREYEAVVSQKFYFIFFPGVWISLKSFFFFRILSFQLPLD